LFIVPGLLQRALLLILLSAATLLFVQFSSCISVRAFLFVLLFFKGQMEDTDRIHELFTKLKEILDEIESACESAIFEKNRTKETRRWLCRNWPKRCRLCCKKRPRNEFRGQDIGITTKSKKRHKTSVLSPLVIKFGSRIVGGIQLQFNKQL
jgi:hypothetical protein